MALIDVSTAKLELRVTHDAEDSAIERKIAAAVEQAATFLGRNVYEDQAALDAAKAAAPAAVAVAKTAYDAAIEAAAALEDSEQRFLAGRLAKSEYGAALLEWDRTMRGIVVNDSVRTAILLTTASLWEHRGDENGLAGVPQAAYTFLWPYRIGLGV